MNWYYAKDGQQTGPVAFAEIERLHAAGELADDSLVWQQGTPNWVKLSSVLAPPSLTPAEAAADPAPVTEPLVAADPTGSRLPDYGDFLCWGIIAVLVPYLGFLVYLVLVVLHYVEYFAIRKAVETGQLPETDYSKMKPVLFILGLFCCGTLLYPLFMNYREKSGYFKPQPKAVIIAVIVLVLSLFVGTANVYFKYANGNLDFHATHLSP